MRKDHLSHISHKIAGLIPLILVIITALILVFLQSKSAISGESAEKLSRLNYKYDMVVTGDLLAGSDSRLIADLYEANVMSDNSYDPDAKGIILSFKDGFQEGGILLLQPMHKFADNTLSQIAREYLETIPELEYAETDQSIELSSPAYSVSNFNNEEVVLAELGDDGSKDSEITVAVIDSGLDMEHEFFDNTKFLEGWNTADNNDDISDLISHGTHMTGIIVQNAPDAVIIPYKIANANGAKLSNVLSAFSYAIKSEADVINTSFGVSGNSYALYKMLNKAEEEGIIVVSAAGNNGRDENFYPATYGESIAVAGVDDYGEKMPRSNFGEWVDLAALGNRIYSAVPGNLYAYKSGTSPATAYVSAVVANMLMENPNLTKEEILRALYEGDKISEGELAGVAIVK